MNKNLLILSVVALTIIAGGYYLTNNQTQASTQGNSDQQISLVPTGSPSATITTVVTPSASPSAENVDQLKIEDTVVGAGAEAVAGKTVTVNYSGTLVDGTKFDSSYDRGQPFSFHLGAGEVIKGWDQGVAGMKVGGKRKLTIPSSLGYGPYGAGNVIPPNATLVFEVELLKVE